MVVAALAGVWGGGANMDVVVGVVFEGALLYRFDENLDGRPRRFSEGADPGGSGALRFLWFAAAVPAVLGTFSSGGVSALVEVIDVRGGRTAEVGLWTGCMEGGVGTGTWETWDGCG